MEDNYEEFGACPNCNRMVHVSDLGTSGCGCAVCVYCYEEHNSKSCKKIKGVNYVKTY